MQWPRVQFTVRRMMVVVAIAGVLLWPTRWLGTRVRAYRWMVDYHAAKMAKYLVPGPPGTPPDLVDSRGEVLSVERDRWHAEMWAEYRRAARYPWLSVEPDPPRPK
jgi:hypothetical protein